MRYEDSLTLSDDIREVLVPWMTRQRWYSGKRHKPRARLIGSWDLPGNSDAMLRTYLIMDDGGPRPVLYQVPFTVRREPLPGGDDALIGTLGGGLSRRSFLYDGPRDPAYASALLSSIVHGDSWEGAAARVHGKASRQLDVERARSRLLNAEQSNTSIVYESEGEGPAAFAPTICKVFRTLHHGENPDVEVESALSAAGSEHVPSAVGSLTAQWVDPERRDGLADGDIAFAQEFVADSVDGWTLALREASEGRDFRERAWALGEATAHVHTQLATVFPAVPADISRIERITTSWHRRLAIAVAEVPEIGALADSIRLLYESVSEGSWPGFQRIHGDFHLGQVLSTPDERWLLIDFEGEPLRPMAERAEPDVAARDVAGMLRSFDYVAASLPYAPGADEWALNARSAFLEAYSATRPGASGFARLLDAFEIDKAVYEAVYEARNRPEWTHIPLAALKRLVAVSR